jgi:Nitroreductase
MRPEAAFESALACLHSRQSISPKHLGSPGPSPSDLDAIVRAAGAAPDHGGLRPFRAILIGQSSRVHLADILVEAKRRRQPDLSPELLDRERQKALKAPTLLVVCARLLNDVASVPVAEQLISVGAAIQGVLLAAHALGFGAILLSGEKTRDPLVREALGLGADEILVGFISIGTIRPSDRPAKCRRAVEEYLTTWTGPSWRDGIES